MSEGLGSRSNAGADADNAGCVVFLIDESTAMDTRIAGGTKSKADCIATALNSLLNQLTVGPNLDVAVVGYRGCPSVGQEVCPTDGLATAEDLGCRWGQPLAGQTFVTTRQLADSPLTIENRVRKVPGPVGTGTAGEQAVRFPVWYIPVLGQAVSPAGAYQYCYELLSSRPSTPGAKKPPLVISLVGELSQRVSLQAIVGKMQGLAFPGGGPLVFHAHLSSSARIPPTLYPCADAQLASGAVRELFRCSSVLPDQFSQALRQFQVTVNVGARGMVYNAKMVDLIRFLSLVKAYSTYRPAVRTTPGE